MSHPAWVCGLKLFHPAYSPCVYASHPAWVCGLKQYIQNYLTKIGYVTPCVGVWIETTTMRTYFAQVEVTPCVGVWIETSSIT